MNAVASVKAASCVSAAAIGMTLARSSGLLKSKEAIDDGRAAAAVERIGNKHDEALSGEASAHVAEDRAEAENVRPDQHGGPEAFTLRIEERAVGGAVGGFDIDIAFHDLAGGVRGLRRQHHGRGDTETESTTGDGGVVGEALMDEFIAHDGVSGKA